MAEQFYTILTRAGKAKIANATALGVKVNLTKFQVGDGGGSYYNPSEDQTQLRNKVWEGNISSISVDNTNPNWIVLEVIIPSDIGGFMIREAGVFDDGGNLIAIGKYPETYKPAVQNGSTKDLYIRMILEVSNTSSVTLKVDPTVILATKKDVDVLSNDLTNFKQEVNTHLADIANFDRKTYSELKALKDSSQLKEGKRYILTDYRTKYRQPDTNVIKEMEVEELILTASSINTFEPIVYSSKYPQDTIWYDFDNNKCEDKTTPRNGFITRRYDHITGNNVPQDWRTMLWARWKPDVNQYYKNDVLTNYSVWTGGNAKMGVIYKAGNKLLVAKNTNVPSKIDDSDVFDTVYEDITIGTLRSDKTKILSQTTDKLELKKGELHERLTFGDSCSKNVIGECGSTLHNNVFGNNCYSNSFGNICYSNSFGNNCYSNSFGNICYSNSFGDSCHSNSLDTGCRSNSFGNDCDANRFGNNCYSNSFGNNCDANSFGNNCYSNSFGNNCDANSFGNNCYSNSFGNNCYSNSFGDSCHSNSFGDSCTANSFDNNCRSNSFGDDCSTIHVKALRNKTMIGLDIYSKSYTINIEKNNDGKYVFWYINSSNQPVYTLIP
ncbi:phage tail protein [Clostridium cochlearium]|uniref:phage tail protein n=1 Tax=Clostridium cochlearium TaxID=1494 RepID=UPI0014594D9A|nr:phage tail protein [Clostridium cochlearium]NME95371.1 phage tail protein [Clostridium cochlearium]